MFAVRPICVQDSILKMSSESPDLASMSYFDSDNIKPMAFYLFLDKLWDYWYAGGIKYWK